MSKVVTVWVELTQLCQLKCRFCYNAWRSEPPANHRSMDECTLDEVILFSRRLSAHYPIQFALAGGDPTAHPRWIDAVGQFLQVAPVTVVTHGTSIDIDDVRRLLPSEHLKFQVSLPSIDEVEYRFLTGGQSVGAAASGLAKLNYLSIPISLTSTVTRKNADSINRVADFALTVGASYLVLNKFISEGRGALYNQEFSISDDSFQKAVSSLDASSFARKGLRVLVSGEASGLRSRKVDAPKLSVNVDGKISVCSMASKHLGSVSDDATTMLTKYRNFWSSNEFDPTCACSMKNAKQTPQKHSALTT